MISPEKKAKLIWNCRRGMLELDMLLAAFVANGLERLTDAQIDSFECLLSEADPDIYAWLMGYESPINKDIAEIVTFIRFYDNV